MKRYPLAGRLCGLLLLGMLPLVGWARTHAERAAAAGTLTKEKGLPVLRLFGSDLKERGFAHGWFLGEHVITVLDDAMDSLPLFTAEKYKKRLLGWAEKRFVWDEAVMAEMDGLFEGMEARLGAKGLICKKLDRALTRRDIFAINCIADYFGPGCSGFTAWRKRTEKGEVVHGRNLDFPIGSRAMKHQVIFVSTALPKAGKRKARKAWVGVGWPGLVGIYSAMNEDGLVCCLHDANNVLAGGKQNGFINRGLLLRSILERVHFEQGDVAASAAKIVAEHPAACGNLFHLSWPAKIALKAKSWPGAVLEFDAAGRGKGGSPVHIRRMTDSDYLVLTNHYRKRAPADSSCVRFQRITAGIKKLTQDNGKIDYKKSRKILIGGEPNVPITAHTIVFYPDSKRLYVSITRGNVGSTRAVGMEFSIDKLLGKKRKKSK